MGIFPILLIQNAKSSSALFVVKCTIKSMKKFIWNTTKIQSSLFVWYVIGSLIQKIIWICMPKVRWHVFCIKLIIFDFFFVILAHSSTKKLYCSYCKKSFNNYLALEEHSEKQCQKRDFACQYCGRRFSRPHEKVWYIFLIHL